MRSAIATMLKVIIPFSVFRTVNIDDRLFWPPISYLIKYSASVKKSQAKKQSDEPKSTALSWVG